MDEIAHHIDVQNLEEFRITKVVDPAAIDQRVFILPREVSATTGWLSREVSRGHSRYKNTSCQQKAEVSRRTEGLNIKCDQRGSACIKL